MRLDSVKIKAVIGLVIMISSIIAMYWWEQTGRADIMFSEVFVVKKDFYKGDTFHIKYIEKVKVLPSNIIENSLKIRDLKKFEGRKIGQFIPKGNQITEAMILKKNDIQKENSSIFKIKNNWIENMSSSIRKGDIVDILDSETQEFLGKFKIAYVKDQDQCEVTSDEGIIEDNILKRKTNSAVIDSIEIISTLEEYKKLENRIKENQGKFLVVQRGEI